MTALPICSLRARASAHATLDPLFLFRFRPPATGRLDKDANKKPALKGRRQQLERKFFCRESRREQPLDYFWVFA
jgi:hypothetical protein